MILSLLPFTLLTIVFQSVNFSASSVRSSPTPSLMRWWLSSVGPCLSACDDAISVPFLEFSVLDHVTMVDLGTPFAGRAPKKRGRLDFIIAEAHFLRDMWSISGSNPEVVALLLSLI